jgi:hypothetical protein
MSKLNVKTGFCNITIVVCLIAAAASSGCTARSRAFDIELDQQKLTVKQGSVEILGYQSQPLADPIGGDKFKGSNFIHPLKTPSGFTVTQLQPADHLHHFGLWWPWKYIKIDDRQILCWELQKDDGIIQSKHILDHTANRNGAAFTAISDYIDRKAPGGPRVVLHEKLIAKIAKPVDSPASGYSLDLTITQNCAIDLPIEIVKYRYSGFGFRGAASWNKENSALLTSEGKDRDTSNNTRGRWVRVQGDTPAGGKAGILLMSHPDNYDYPQRLRTWNSKMHNGSVFVNFNPVQEKSWTFQPGKDYTQQYQMFVYDGAVTAQQCQQLWQQYTRTSKKK